jgi:hypothetical protein
VRILRDDFFEAPETVLYVIGAIDEARLKPTQQA